MTQETFFLLYMWQKGLRQELALGTPMDTPFGWAHNDSGPAGFIAMEKQEKKMKKITVCQGAGIESHLLCWRQLTQTVKMNVGVLSKHPAQALHRGFSQLHFLILNHTGALRMCAYWSTSHAEDNTEKPLSDVPPHLHGVAFLSTFPSQVCRGVEAFLWGLYSDIRLGGQYETPPTQTWEWYQKDHKGWADSSVTMSTCGSFRGPKFGSH